MLNTPSRMAGGLNFLTLFRTPPSGLQPTIFGHSIALFPIFQSGPATMASFGRPFLDLISVVGTTLGISSPIISTVGVDSRVIDTLELQSRLPSSRLDRSNS